MKKCNKCNDIKDYDFFSKAKSYKDNYSTTCKSCIAENSRNWYKKNKEKHNALTKKKYQENKENYKKRQEKNKEHIKEYKKEYYKKNKERCIELSKERYKKNKENINKRNLEYINKRKQKDFVFKFKQNTRSLIYNSFKKGTNQYKKNSKTEKILGCTIEEFRYYIESKFKKGMSFYNHGEWHLDHIIPLASANSKNDIIRLNHYTNFQPLWAEDNLSKSDKIIEQQLTLI
jgi:hypothetical protein